MKVNDMDKYQLTEAIRKTKEIIYDPETSFHFCGPGRDEILEAIDEINNPPTDKDGYIHKYYLKEDTKGLIEIFLRSRNN